MCGMPGHGLAVAAAVRCLPEIAAYSLAAPDRLAVVGATAVRRAVLWVTGLGR